MLREGVNTSRVGDFALRGDSSIEDERLRTRPSGVSPGLFFAQLLLAVLFGLLYAICPTADEQQQTTRERL
jgi:hypothetical protein